MARKFLQLSTEQLDDDKAERIRRSQSDAISELQTVVRQLHTQSANRCIGVVHYTMSADQAGVVSDDTIGFDTKGRSTLGDLGLVEINSTSLNLKVGYTYRLTAAAQLNTTTDRMEYIWRDNTAGANIGIKAAIFDFAASSGNGSDQPVASHLFTPTKDTNVEVRISYAAGAPDVLSLYSWAAVEVFLG
jgi:hypothetical protein